MRADALQVVAHPKAKSNLRAEVMAKAPHMQPRKPTKSAASKGGFRLLDLGDNHDDLDGEFTRRSA